MAEPREEAGSHEVERYRRLEIVGRGATGTVYRALDRLSGRVVALKTVANDPASSAASPAADRAERAALLEREFLLLATLRHPNVIAALDYDAEGGPFFTMDLQDQALDLRRAADGRSIAERIALLVQLLHALAYVHRRGLVHRDVKPENALVARGVVRLVDFGLAASATESREEACGTLAYAAPEVLRGAPPSARSDLYAVGVVAHEMLAGRHPFDASSAPALLRSMFRGPGDVPIEGVPRELSDVVWRLLAREPSERFADALDVVDALTRALGQPLPVETAATRASFLYGAELVGRDAELARLVDALPKAGAPAGRAILVSGESGAGKSRLVEELAARAMVRGARVLRGQTVREASRPYEVWRGALRGLVTLAAPTDHEAAVLEDLVPDVGALLGRSVPRAPELDPEATHVRLARVVEALLRRTAHPVVVVLEDLQWAGTEGVKLLSRVQALAAELPVLVVATYRSDERPGLRDDLAPADEVALERLPPGDVARLCASIAGADAARLEDVVFRASRGNVFLVLEVLRTLADEAGGLARVAAADAPPRLFAGEVEGLVRRRVDRLSDDDRAFLRTAAVAGRELDLDVLARVHPGFDVAASAARAVHAAVLSSAQGRWWFAHDRVRDALIASLPDEDRRTIHARLAHATLAAGDTHPSTLAHHFGAAGDHARERRFAALAGDRFLRSGAYHEAIPFLRRALALAPAEPLDRARLERQLGEALFRCGRLLEARESLGAALATLGRPLPASRPRLVAGMARAALAQVRLRARRRAPSPPSPREVVRHEEAILAYTQLSRLAHHLNDEPLVLHVTLAALNLSEAARLPAHHARLSAVMGAVMGLLPAHRWARLYLDLATTISARLDDPALSAFVLAHRGYYEAGLGRWDDCRAHLERSAALYDRIGDVRLWEESISILAYAVFYRGDLPRALDLYAALERSGEERVDRQIVSWGLTNRIKVLVRRGVPDDADALLARVATLLVDGITKAVRDGVVVELAQARGEVAEVERAALEAAANLEASPPRSFMACSTYAAVADALLDAWEAALAEGRTEDARRLSAAARRANRALDGVARIFPIAEPARLLHAGTFAALSGRPAEARALWDRAARLARIREQPHEEALALARLRGEPKREATETRSVARRSRVSERGSGPPAVVS